MKTKLLILSLMLLPIILNGIWIQLDQSPPLWDIAGHSGRAAALAHGKSYESIYPPLTYYITAIGFWLFGFHDDVPQYSLLFWLIVYMVAVYYITLFFYQKAWVGIVTVGLSLCYPLLAHFSRVYDLDFSLTAMIMASLAVLLQTKNFAQRNWSLLYGICLGLTALTKWTGLLFLIAPTIYFLLARRYTTKNILTCSIAASVVAGPWYVLHGADVWQAITAAHNNVFSVPFHNLLRPANIVFYAKQLILSTGWPLALFWISGLLLFVVRNTTKRWLLIVSILVPYLIMTFGFYSKESRYILPLLPLLALCTSALFVYVQAWWRWAMLGGCIIIASWLWLETSWHIRLFPNSFYHIGRFENMYGYQIVTPKKPRFGFTYPTSYHANLPDLSQVIIGDLQTNPITDRPVRIAVVPNSIFLTAQQISYYMSLTTTTPFEYALSSQLRQGTHWQQVLSQADYIITKTGDQGPKVWQPNGEIIRQAEASDGSIFHQFTVIYTATLQGIEDVPTTVKIYRKK